ncbi:GumC family protein [Aurantiacibacter rhizosphaerae]|uniref:Polysaccharide chain length determinant N-terminal domain-containing protein n=1 Tax=Aurantiacibacter rhizosphaerae TaxID=2691582 RepID=A0A844XEE7_9SPHN|nr:Wzz/FepE/Etk N-terminal domain-containing protein [Aurantiacibacter rhizosphaerae]MWV28951.1 hypothetical protein [Aurantiacibacter rhizosphaerae]
MTQHQSLEDGRSGNLPARREFSDLSEARDLGNEPRDPRNEFSPIPTSSIWSIIWARKLWLLGAAIIGLLLALGYSFLQTPLYRSTSTIELNAPTAPVTASGSGVNETAAPPPTDEEYLDTQVGILRSRALAERVVQDLELVPPAADGQPRTVAAIASEIADGLSVDTTENSRIIELSYVSPDAGRAAHLVNGFANSYIQLALDRKYDATVAARDFLEKRIDTVREEMNGAERDLVRYAQANGIILLGGEGGESAGSGNSLTGNTLTSINAALAEAQQKRITAEQRFRQASSIGETNTSTAALRQELASVKAEYEEKST